MGSVQAEVRKRQTVQTTTRKHYTCHDNGGYKHTVPHQRNLRKSNHSAENTSASGNEYAEMKAEISVVACYIHKYLSLLIMFKMYRSYMEKVYICIHKPVTNGYNDNSK